MGGEKMKIKKRMTADQEFEILKLVLDKYLWLGTGVMVFGLYRIIAGNAFGEGIAFLIAGTVLLTLFLWLIVKEYEFLK
jgi:hypothetical protein